MQILLKSRDPGIKIQHFCSETMLTGKFFRTLDAALPRGNGHHPLLDHWKAGDNRDPQRRFPAARQVIYPWRVSSPYHLDGSFRAPALGSAAFEAFCRTFFTCYCPLTVEGRHHLPEGPFLLCSNHASHADSAVLMTASGRSFRSFAMLGASDYFFRSATVRWSVSPLMSVIPINRHPGAKSLVQCLETCRHFLQTGGSLILYPEGTRSPDGEMRAFKSGAGLFASELGVPVIPAYVEGTHRILPKGRFVPRPGSVSVRFGAPLVLPHTNGQSLRDQRRAVTEQLARNIQLLANGCRTQELVATLQHKG
jgi:1-acyl-sn-glycerol-3-phosphate acyltransferase